MDGTAPADLFENAARYESELTERQRDVMRLIAAGKTNGEIADALDMTLAGAKWHVSELLTKLGFESREAAAAYYRWREAPHRRFARSVRGLLSTAAMKVGLGAAAGGAAIAVGAAALFAMTGDEPNVGPAEPGLPFYMEAVTGRSDANMRSQANARFWFESKSTLRIESDTPRTLWNAPGHEVGWGAPGTSVTVFDGEHAWSGINAPGLYYQSRPLEEPYLRRPWALDSTRLGPVYDDDLEAFLAIPRPDTRIERQGTERVLGIKTERVRFVSTIMVNQPGSEAGEPGSDVTFWIDPDRMLILKYESRLPNNNGLVISAEVTKLEYGQRQPAEKFAWVPAAGAIESRCKSYPEVLRGTLPAPFVSFPVELLLDGWVIRSGGVNIIQGDSECGSARMEMGSPGNDGQTLLQLDESSEAPMSVLTGGEPLALGEVTGQVSTAEGWTSVAWLDGEVGVRLSSSVLTQEELVVMAEAMLAEQR